jgi:hypothetical protein
VTGAQQRPAPLYLKNVPRFWGCDDDGVLHHEALEKYKAGNEVMYDPRLECNGQITDIAQVYRLCNRPRHPRSPRYFQDGLAHPRVAPIGGYFCFTGHKGLFGPAAAPAAHRNRVFPV